MPFTGTIANHIQAVASDHALAAQQTCHDGASGIVTLLGTGAGVIAACPITTSQDGIYRLDIVTVENVNPGIGVHVSCNFDHSLVILKLGTDIALLQCFSRRYTMAQWIAGTGVVSTAPCSIYSPLSSFAGGSVAFTSWASHLPGLATAFDAREWVSFDRLSSALFGAAAFNEASKKYAPVHDIRMNLRWTRFAFAP